MPADLTNKTTIELLDILEDAQQQILWPSAVNELQSRIIPNDYSVTECRGGIRPTSQPLNP